MDDQWQHQVACYFIDDESCPSNTQKEHHQQCESKPGTMGCHKKCVRFDTHPVGTLHRVSSTLTVVNLFPTTGLFAACLFCIHGVCIVCLFERICTWWLHYTTCKWPTQANRTAGLNEWCTVLLFSAMICFLVVCSTTVGRPSLVLKMVFLCWMGVIMHGEKPRMILLLHDTSYAHPVLCPHPVLLLLNLLLLFLLCYHWFSSWTRQL